MKNQDKRMRPELRFIGFDGDWEVRVLGEILTFKNGINASKEQYGHGYKFINVLDIINNQTIQHDEIIGSVSVSKEVFEKNKVEYGDILFLRSSEVREEAGQTNVYLDKNISATFGGFVIRGQQKEEYSPKFMNYMFKTSHARKEITQKSNGSTRYNVGQDTLSKVLIYQAKLQEQTKIANFLSTVDDKITNTEKQLELFKDYKKGMMQRVFSQEIRFKNDDGGDFPDWVKKRLEQVLHIKLREIDKPIENYLAIGIRSHMKGTFQKPNSDPKSIAMDKLFIVRSNDLIVNITFAWEGAIAIVKPEDDGGLVSHRFPTYEFNSSHLICDYFRNVIKSKKFKYALDLISPGGAGRNRVMSKKEFLKMISIFPSLEEQTQIANFLSTIDEKIEVIDKSLAQLKLFKKSLLQRMFV